MIFFSCKESEDETEVCGCEGTKTETVNNIFGFVIETDDGFEILTDEKGLLSTCIDLTQDFKKDFQSVIVSGQLKPSCKKIFGEFYITPIDVTEISIGPTTYYKTDITLSILKTEDYGYEPGFGYCIQDTRTTLGGTLCAYGDVKNGIPLKTYNDAVKMGLLSIYISRGNVAFITPEILEYINVIE